MNLLVYIEENIENSSLEVLSFADKIKKYFDVKIYVFCKNVTNNESLNKFNIEKIFTISSEECFSHIDIKCLEDIVEKKDISIVLIPQTENGNYISNVLSGKTNIPLVKNIIDVPKSINPIILEQRIFSNRAISVTQLDSDKVIICVPKNIFGIVCNVENNPEIENIEVKTESIDVKIEEIENNNFQNKVNLSEAKVVISGGRGMQSSDNWEMLEVFSKILKDSALACSKPVSDNGWRPHSEHVGQTGKTISPDLYIAVGISGAIQHLGGVVNSKKIMVINKDKDAPFFKYADYGIVGDALTVIPRLINKLSS